MIRPFDLPRNWQSCTSSEALYLWLTDHPHHPQYDEVFNEVRCREAGLP